MTLGEPRHVPVSFGEFWLGEPRLCLARQGLAWHGRI